MNTTIVKMKEEGGDRYKQINESIANMEKKISDIDEKCENRNDEPNRFHDDQNQGKAVVTRFHSETSEAEVEQLLKETITEIGMSIDNVRIECPAKPNTLLSSISRTMTRGTNTSGQRTCRKKKELRGKKIKMTRSFDTEEKISSEKNGICQNTASKRDITFFSIRST